MGSGGAEKVVAEISDFLAGISAGRVFVIGVSTGIDSSVVLTICSRIPHATIHAYFMFDTATPETDFTDLAELEKRSGVKVERIDISPIERAYEETLDGRPDRKVSGNLKARIRMSILYYFANLYSGIVVGTTNRSEYLTGYFTKFGDGACDVEPIIHLYKDEIRAVAKHLNLPDHIVKKSPSAGLWPGQTDEAELGMTYDQLDGELRKLEGGESSVKISKTVMDMMVSSEHKRKMPPSLLDRR